MASLNSAVAEADNDSGNVLYSPFTYIFALHFVS